MSQAIKAHRAHTTTRKVLGAQTMAAAIHHAYKGAALPTNWQQARRALIVGNRYAVINAIAYTLRTYSLPSGTRRQLELALLMVKRGSIATARKLARTVLGIQSQEWAA